MRTRMPLSFAAVILPALVACQSAQEPKAPEAPASSISVTSGPSVGINAVPTAEPGIYRINVGMERITGVRIVPKKSDGTDGRTVEASEWNFDPSRNQLRMDAPVDDARERVIVLGIRLRPPQVMLPAGVMFDSVRVVVGDRLGVEGRDYTIDRTSGMLKLLGRDTVESPLSYFVQAMLQPDPAHPERTQSVAFGNRGDHENVRRLIADETH